MLTFDLEQVALKASLEGSGAQLARCTWHTPRRNSAIADTLSRWQPSSVYDRL